ncbi:hypothetical protein [Aeromicrobium chenweiae]|uniref:Uncharacterized protein n=1 Tax=Aeromicrobium chenweiae TaxID=2079793 RepID=A0A2S0WIL4_9ACTN|nr:hypothetical protein [Aeromicrobium chenweiae]AWB91147.1 hypothetical protein C3E78_02305 [Aeromicrobium chenweiae]TGN31667.1 hypothetical protein E4L97_11820 [Aeromicrobium chenweiae]
MGHTISGYAEFVVEVQAIVDDSANVERFVSEIQDSQAARYLTLLPSGNDYPPAGAMVAGLIASSHYVRYSGPAGGIVAGMSFLRELCRECFPREH